MSLGADRAAVGEEPLENTWRRGLEESPARRVLTGTAAAGPAQRACSCSERLARYTLCDPALSLAPASAAPLPAPHYPIFHFETPKDTLSVCQSPWSAGPTELENYALVTIWGHSAPEKARGQYWKPGLAIFFLPYFLHFC